MKYRPLDVSPSEAHHGRTMTEHEHHDHDHDHDHEHEHVVSYPDAVSQFRAQKDTYYKSGLHSPIPVEERGTFEGLPYYPVDEGLVFEERRLEPYTGNEPSDFQIPTSDGKMRAAHRAGYLSFEVGAEQRRLTAYTFDGDGDEGFLFVPFVDATSGSETYGAGRYLDLEPEDDGTYTLDFNLAYHPSCVYDAKFSCPLTPSENRLPVRIEAGERLPAGEVA